MWNNKKPTRYDEEENNKFDRIKKHLLLIIERK